MSEVKPPCSFDGAVQITRGTTRAAAVAAAGIWARATTLRDRLDRPATAAEKLPGVEAALDRTGAQLLLAQSSTEVAAFALLVPSGAATEVLYLATDPVYWGRGVARHLLDFIREQARITQTNLELWAITSNDRAIRTYERAGWMATSDEKVRYSSGPLERRFALSLT